MALARDTTAPTTTRKRGGYVMGYDAKKGGLGWSFGTPAPSTATASRPKLSYGRLAGKTPTVRTGSNLTYGHKQVGMFDVGNFMRTMSMGINQPAAAQPSRKRQRGRSGGGLYAETVSGSPIPNIPTVTPGNVDGGSGGLSALGDLAGAVLGAIGSMGDGAPAQPATVHQAAATGGGSDGIGVTPMMIAGGSLAVGVIYWLVSK